MPSPFGGGDYGADALSLMQHLSHQSASAYMEAEQILSRAVCKAQDGMEADDQGNGEKEQVQDQELDSGQENDGKENRIVGTEKQYCDMPVCSPGSLLVCMCSQKKAQVF